MKVLGFLIFSALAAVAAQAPYTERGKTDFDTFLTFLVPYGTWVKDGAVYRFHPARQVPPMSEGQWIYTDWGWYFRGSAPYSFITDHYGRWVREANGDWVWQPDPLWHPQKIEWRGTPAYVGWRPSKLSRDGELVEKESERYATADEWIFIPIEKMKGPVSPKDVVTGEEAKKLLETSEPLFHTYTTYREIDRMGPDPFKVLAQAKDPKPYQPGKSVAGHPDATNTAVPAPPPTLSPLEKVSPQVAAQQDDGEIHPSKPSFNYYTVMSLPDIRATPPENAKTSELYVYRPVFFQDADGVNRRVELFLHPRQTMSNRDKVNVLLQGGSLDALTAPTNAPAAPTQASPPPVAAPAAVPVPVAKAVPVVAPPVSSASSAKHEGALSK